MNPGFRSLCVIAVLVLVSGAFSLVAAQSPSATPDPFVAQITSSESGFASFAGDMSANGRFVVFESNGNLDTQNPRNADGNREIFLFDYAQRRIFQITNTKNVLKPPASPTPTPTPAASPTPTPTPTPTPGPTPADLTLVKLEISSNRPMISLEPALVAGKRAYTIVFSSNAPNPGNFDGADSAALVADANQEIWVYLLPEIDDTFDLTSGDELPLTDLSAGVFRQVTNTTPSRPIIINRFPPDAVDDNREASISDDGNTIAFISTRDLVPTSGNVIGNADGNPELFFVRTTNRFAAGTNTFAQGTRTQDTVPGVSNTIQQNPSISGNGGKVAFYSRANLAAAGTNADLNAEVFVADFTGTGLANVRQITITKNDLVTDPHSGLTLNLFSAGRRISRDGAYVVYETRAENPTADSASHTGFLAVFVSRTSDGSSQLVGPRATGDPQNGDLIHFPTFTDYDGSLAPGSIMFASALNFKTDGTLGSAVDDATGLNPAPTLGQRQVQVFVTPNPLTSAKSFSRLTKNPTVGLTPGLNPLASNTRRRFSFSLAATELGGGNGDGSTEVFYVNSPPVTTESAAALSFFTGASNMGPLPSASPTASPTPTPSPTPGVPAGLAPGELSIVRSTAPLANSDKAGIGGSETARRPILPVELNGVSVSVNGSAAGLYFVGDTPADGIHFVMPIGLGNSVATFVVNNRGTTYRGFVQIVSAQPDIFTTTNDAGGRAVACNVTNTAVSGCVTEPFKVLSTNSSGTEVATVLELHVTGTRLAAAAETKVSFVNGTTTIDVTPSFVRPNTNMFGEDLITLTLPASLAGSAPIDYKVIVTVTKGAVVTTSRPAATAPSINIIP